MFSCLRQSFILPRKLFTCNINSSSKSFSALSSTHNKHISNYDTNFLLLKKTSKPKQIQHRYFSLDYVNSFFESIRTSEANKLLTGALIGAHDFTGISWSATIFASAVIMKLIVSLPCGIYQQYLIAILELTKIELDAAAKKIRDAVEKKAILGRWTNSKFQYEFHMEVRQMWKTLVVKNNCHPFKITILFLMQLPFWLLLTVAIRSLAMDASANNISQMENPLTALQFRVGGPFWCQDLSLPDPTYTLPAINALCMLAVTELSLASRTPMKIANNFKTILVNKIIPTFLRAFAVVFFIISSVSPSGLSLFWMSSSLVSLCQNVLLMSPRMRRFLRIPKTVSEVDKPYSHALNNFSEKLEKIFSWKK